MEFEPALLRDAIDVGLELAGARTLKPLEGGDGFSLPSLSDAWQQTLDHLRPPRRPDQPFWEWRNEEPQRVAFHPEHEVEGQVQLHLSHPFVRRILSRFTAQGFSAHDLHRVSIVPNRNESMMRVIAFGRLTLFGGGATRLHDCLVPVAALWLESGDAGHLEPMADATADRRALAQLESLLSASPRLNGIPKRLQDRLRAGAAADYATLWPAIRHEADSLTQDAKAKLAGRAAQEARDLRSILLAQRAAIEKQTRQLPLPQGKQEQAQLKLDVAHMEGRLSAIDTELEREPAEIQARYQVVQKRLSAVGMIYLVPTSMLGN